MVIHGCTEQKIICSGCTKKIYRSQYDEENCCVPNPFYDPKSNNPYKVNRVLSVNLHAERLRDLPAQLLMAPCSWATFEKRIPFIEAARNGRLASSTAKNARAAAAAAAAAAKVLEEAGDAIPLTMAELHEGLDNYKTILDQANNRSTDLVMVNKVSILGDEILGDESERKLFNSNACFVVKSNGNTAIKNDGTFVVIRADSVEDLVEKVERSRTSTVSLPLTYAYVDLQRSTDHDSACDLEKRCQDYSNAIKLNHTEDEKYHKGSVSKKTPHGGACAGIIVDVLPAVQEGLLYFNSSMHAALKTRILTNYPWARDKSYWRKEATAARERGLAKTRERNANRSKKKKAAAMLERDSNGEKKKAAKTATR